MPITIVAPQTGEPFGPGFWVEASTDIIGPLEPGTWWRIVLTAPAFEDSIVFMQDFIGQHAIFTPLLAKNFDQLISSTAPRALQFTGDNAQLQVLLISPTSGALESATVQVVLDREQGQVQELAAIMRNQVQIAPTLTPAEHDAVLQTNVGVIAMSGIDPLQLAGDIVQAIATSNPLGYGSLTSPMETLTGDGEMPDDAPLLPKWGLYWIASVIPTSLSHRHGQSEEYPSRLVQWRTVHEVGGVEMVTEIVDSLTHGELWRFRFQRPRRLEYSILPGVTIMAAWWQFP